jgi:hypothetical protein
LIGIGALAAFCLLFAQNTMAINLNSQGTNATSTAAGYGAQNGNTARFEALQKQYEKLLALINEFKAKFGQNATSTTASAADLDCARNAVSARETAIASAHGTLGNCTATSLSGRKSAMDAAWQIATGKDRNSAINKAWQNFEKTKKACQSAYREAVKNAWGTFKTAIKSCNIDNAEGNREGADLSSES